VVVDSKKGRYVRSLLRRLQLDTGKIRFLLDRVAYHYGCTSHITSSLLACLGKPPQKLEEQGHRRLPPAPKVDACHNGKVISVSTNALDGLVGRAGAEVCVTGATCTEDGCVCDNGSIANGIDPAASELGEGCDLFKFVGAGETVVDALGNPLPDGGGDCQGDNGNGDGGVTYYNYCHFELDSYQEAIDKGILVCTSEPECIGFSYDILGCGCQNYIENCDENAASVYCKSPCWGVGNVPGKFSLFTLYDSTNLPPTCDDGSPVLSNFGSATAPIVGTTSNSETFNTDLTCPGNDNSYSCYCKNDGVGCPST